MLRLLMVGAGGIGGYYSARLLAAGHQVVLTARGAHLQALQKQGLRIDYEGSRLVQKVDAVGHEELVSRYQADDFDVVVITLKAIATASVMEELGSWLRKGRPPVLSLQNGVDNEPLLADAIGADRVIGGLAVRIGGHIAEPGVIKAEGPAQIVMGEWPSFSAGARRLLLEKLEAAFNAAGIPTVLSDNIRYELWRKLVINNGVNPLSALTGLDTRSLTRHPELGKIVYGMWRKQ